MSIQGIRKIRDNRKGSFQLYEIDQIQKSIDLKRSQQLKLTKIDNPKSNKILDSSRDNETDLSQSMKIKKKPNPFARNKDYQFFLDQELHIEQIHLPLHSHKRDSLLDAGIKSFSSREHRNQIATTKASSRLFDLNMEPLILNPQKQKTINKSNFSLEYVVGKGGFGKVWRVRQKKTGKIYAMKQMLKIKIINKKSVGSVMNQKLLLQKLHHPFLVNMKYAFQDTENLYLVMDYVNCGDLRYHIGNRRKFTEIETKFFICCILIALEYLHSNKIIHRDIKPQNLVIDNEGYVKVTDLGISRQFRLNNSSDTSGTPGYMSPEVICKGDHSFTADFFAVGVIGYQFMLGKRPYVGRNRQQIRQQILAKQVKIEEAPSGWSTDAVDFINKLIQRKPQNRLGVNGINQVKSHNWLKDFDWNGLKNRTLKVPFKPLTIEQDYKNYKQCISSDTIIEQEQQCRLLLKNAQTQQLFEGYEFNVEKGSNTNKHRHLVGRQSVHLKK